MGSATHLATAHQQWQVPRSEPSTLGRVAPRAVVIELAGGRSVASTTRSGDVDLDMLVSCDTAR